jgi:hypothetical protein
MRFLARVSTLTAALALVAIFSPGCSCSSDSETGSNQPKHDAGSDAADAGEDAASDAADGDGGAEDAGDAGDGGDAMASFGPSTGELVSAGDVSKGPGYRMVHTLGQPTQNQEISTSPGYRMQGGIVGATSP